MRGLIYSLLRILPQLERLHRMLGGDTATDRSSLQIVTHLLAEWQFNEPVDE